MDIPLSTRIRQGFQTTLGRDRDALEAGRAEESALCAIDLEELPRLVRDPAQSARQREQLWAAVIRRFRRGPAEPWGAVLLEMLSPHLVGVVAVFQSMGSALTPQEVEDEVMAEILVTARRVNISSPGEIQRRLIQRACIRLDARFDRMASDIEADSTTRGEVQPRTAAELAEAPDEGRRRHLHPTRRRWRHRRGGRPAGDDSIGSTTGCETTEPGRRACARARVLRTLASGVLVAVLLVAGSTLTAYAAPAPTVPSSTDLNTVIDNIRNWLTGLLAALATLFLCIGGIRYLTAMGNQRSMEQGKEAIKSAVIGYSLAILAPILVEILKHILGIG